MPFAVPPPSPPSCPLPQTLRDRQNMLMQVQSVLQEKVAAAAAQTGPAAVRA